jgi:ABC-type nickel/cobalt efflux system permease component RcnA
MARRSVCLPIVFVLAVLLQSWPATAWAADMFGRAEAPANHDEAANPEPPPAAIPAFTLPAPIRALVGRATAVQSRLNSELRGQLQLAREGSSWRPALAIVTISFLYGVFHAVGPGHGKVVVGSYFLTRRARVLHGLAMSGSAALVQSLSAIALVSLLAAVLELGAKQILEQAAALEVVSYGVITLLGLWMAWGVLSRRTCCAHGEEPGHVHDAACQHDDHHDHAQYDHAHHDHAALPAPRQRSELLRVLSTGAAVGLRPCSGAILVLLFTLANDIYPVGIVATFAMGLGVAITVSAVSLGTLGLHRSLSVLGERNAAMADRLRQGAALTGAAVITLFGLLQLVGIWSGLITPMAG